MQYNIRSTIELESIHSYKLTHRASAYLRHRAGIENVYQLEGGIHRYLEAFPKDGGFWVGKNYTFDKRFSHGAENAAVISSCVHCGIAWDRYQAQKTCANKGFIHHF